jgi:hypothetical protein
MTTTRHAIASSALQVEPDGRRRLMSRCGIWVSPEQCDQDLRATCEVCKARIQKARKGARWAKVAP